MEIAIDTIELRTKSKVALTEVYKVISGFKGYYISKESGHVYLASIEERDISDNPKRFFIIDFMPSGVDISFTVQEDESPSVRRLQVLSKALPLLEPLMPKYNLSTQPLLALMDSALTEFLHKFTKDAKEVLIDNDWLKERVKELQNKLSACQTNVKDLTTKLYEVNSELASLRLKLKKYEVPSDEALKQLLIDWIKEHDGEVDIEEFSKVRGVPIARVEDMLTRLVEEKAVKPL